MLETDPLPSLPDVLQKRILEETKDIPVKEKLDVLRAAAEGLLQEGRKPSAKEAAALLGIVLALTDDSYSVYDFLNTEIVDKK